MAFSFCEEQWRFSFWNFFFFVLEIFAILYYANEESDDVIEIFKQCSSKLAPAMYITKETE